MDSTRGLRLTVLGTVALIVSVSAPGCRDPGANAPWTVTDSAGVRVVTTHRLEWEGVRSWAGSLELTVPASGSAPGLSSIGDAHVLPDGRIAILDLQEDRVFVFSKEGILVDSIGRAGQGPGEFVAAMRNMQVSPEGELQVFDRSLRRITTFEPDGSLGRTLTLQGQGFESGDHLSYAWLLGADRVFTWEYIERNQGPVSRSSEAERWVVPGRLRVVDLESGESSVLYESGARDWIVEGSRWWVAPFGPGTSLTLHAGRLHVSPGSNHEIAVVHPDSGLIATYRYPGADRPFDLQALRDLEAEGRREAGEGGYPFMARVLFAPEVQPPLHPAIKRVRVAHDGTVWAQVHAPPQRHASDWWLISPEGRFRGLVRLPGRREILGFTDSLALVVSLDGVDVPSVELWRVGDDAVASEG